MDTIMSCVIVAMCSENHVMVITVTITSLGNDLVDSG